MLTDPSSKYRPFPVIDLPNRQWPSRQLSKAPIWCSVDLRDGNQALAVPMNVAQKLEMFRALVTVGFKEIEVGFPSASQTEFDFNRRIIEGKLIPDDVTIQCLVQAREDLIEKTFQSLQGAKNVIIHMYNSTSPAQRKHVFNKDRSEIIAMAVEGATWIKNRIAQLESGGTKVSLQYSPESFSATELDFAKEISEAVMDVWQPTPQWKMILNLPDTVQYAMPNVHADQIEWICTNIKNRDCLTISLHTHNDRGTGTAATELGLLAGADRVEGTLFGNGERTGNLDIVQVAMNLYMHGISPQLDFSRLNDLIATYERCTGMSVPARHPYSGELVFTAFSGSHQDAIKKGLDNVRGKEDIIWDVPYLTIDPHDIGRLYRDMIRVNSQSGKGGVSFLLESEFGLELPKELQREFGPLANTKIDRLGREVTSEEIKAMFWAEYIDRRTPYALEHFELTPQAQGVKCQARLSMLGKSLELTGTGNGPIAALTNALIKEAGAPEFEVSTYREQSLSEGSAARAVAYILIKIGSRPPPDQKDLRQSIWGAGEDGNIELASIKALLSAVNRAMAI
jgi:2-isopropylmalate synthase